MKNKKVSFDFDSTLNRKDIEDFAFSLILMGVEVWVCTTRAHEDDQPDWLVNGMKCKRGNDDLYEITDKLNIPRERIIFTNHEFKSGFLDDSFIWHLDDDWTEIRELNMLGMVKGISQFANDNWKQDCKKLLKL